MQTNDFLQVIRSDIETGLEEKIIQKLEPIITQMLYANIFTVKETAKYLKIGTESVRQMARRGEITHFMQRGQYYFRQTDLDDYVQKRIIKAERSK